MQSFLLNGLILGIASMWWFFTEIDGISQALGILYYSIALVVISIINIISLKMIRSKRID